VFAFIAAMCVATRHVPLFNSSHLPRPTFPHAAHCV
jgi:hypothetical protein